MSDPRLGLPSASSLETDALCPGRQNLLRTLPAEAFKDDADEEAAMGVRIHKARETMNEAVLEDEQEVTIFRRGLETEKRILEQWCSDRGLVLSAIQEMPRELRLWLNWPDSGDPAASGQLDVHYAMLAYRPTDVLVIDWKSLWCSNLTPAERNWQGRLQAVLAAREYDAGNVRVAFNKAMWGKSDIVEYGANDLKHVEYSIFQALWEPRQSEAQRRAGPHCRYCPGKPYCPEAGAYTMLPSVIANNALDKPQIEAVVAAMVPADLKRVLQAERTVEKIVDAVKARLKGMSDEDLQAIGIARKEGRRLDPIVKTKEAFDYLKQFGIQEEELWQALGFGKGELTKAVQRSQGCGKEATEGWLWKQVMREFIEEKRAKPSLELL